MHLVITKVGVKEGKIKEVLEKFGDSNPDLIKDHEGWIKAIFTANYEDSSITVLAFWKNADSYFHFSKSEEYLDTMKELQSYFTREPEVSVNKMLFEL